MDRQEYLKQYKKYHYYQTRKIVTFPLLNEDYEALKAKAESYDMKVTAFAKELVLNYLTSNPNVFLTPKQQEFIQSYIRISRGIANNINQIAHNTNIGEYIDLNILIHSLKLYEEEFKNLISKLQSS